MYRLAICDDEESIREQLCAMCRGPVYPHRAALLRTGPEPLHPLPERESINRRADSDVLP